MRKPLNREQSEQTHPKTAFMIKNNCIKGLRVFLVAVAVFSFCRIANATLLDNLMVEYTQTPLGIDVKNPRFSWQMTAPAGERQYLQTAYQIVVKDPQGAVVWDTRKVADGASLGIIYTGITLSATTRYTWTVTVWDQTGAAASASSWFETGLMNPDPGLSAWDGAQWIGGGPEDLVLQSHFLSVFKVNYALQLDSLSNSTRASFVLGANDSRLLDKNKNIYNLESAPNGSYIKFELDIAPVDGSEKGLAKFNVYRVGYHPGDTEDKPLFSAVVPKELIDLQNKYDKHSYYLESVFGSFAIYLDKVDNDHRLSPVQGQGFGGGRGLNINPVGNGGDYIAFPLLADIGFSVDPGQNAYFTDVVVQHYREPSNVVFSEDLSGSEYQGIFKKFIGDRYPDFSVKNGWYHLNGGKEGTFVVADPSHNSMPMLRSEFSAEGKKIQAARLYVTSRGIYEVYLNGKRVGSDYFNPGLTQYTNTHMYQTYDVTEMIISGSKNAIGAWLGEGWWSGNSTFIGTNWNFFGDRQSFLAKLVITYEDGSSTKVTTNDRDWKIYRFGPVIYGSFFQGELYDATKEAGVRGWNEAGYDDHNWTKAVEVPLNGTVFSGTTSNFDGTKTSFSFDKMKLTGQIGENAGIVKELTAIQVDEVRPGVFVYDMGQNMVGIPQIKMSRGEPGQRVTLRYAEVKYPDLPEYGQNVGMIMIENIRAALAQDIYVMNGGTEIIQPRFTFHGYRYLEISGITAPLPLESVKGLVISSVHGLTAAYETSEPKINRLWQNIIWSTLGNFLSVPTDCPQRNERMGWSGDLSVFSRTATYVTNSDQFLRRHLLAMRDLQMPSGKFTDIAPMISGFGGLLWGSAGMTVPWELYQQYNDVGLLEEHYDAMVAYVDFLQARINKETGLSGESQLGDWLGPQTRQVETQLLVTAYHILDLEIMVRVAEILNKASDAERFQKMYKERKAFFNSTFVNTEKKTIQGLNGRSADNQTSYAVGLALSAFSDEYIPIMSKGLAESVVRQNKDDGGVIRPDYSLMTGFIGTAWISKALSDNGYSDLAYKLLQNSKYPSWLYSVDQGATTIWERLNGYTVENGFGGNNSMNSFNHYSFGAVGQWMMAYSLGIRRGEPGFKKFILQPEPDPTGQMTWARGYYDSMYGRISSSWTAEGGKLIYEATVPANTTATLYLPASTEKGITEGGQPVKKSKGVTYLRYENGKVVYGLVSGSYKFITDL
jgi:alpha-L-rhamnosidase